MLGFALKKVKDSENTVPTRKYHVEYYIFTNFRTAVVFSPAISR